MHKKRVLPGLMTLTFATCMAATNAFAGSDYPPLSIGFDHPQDSARTKVWWFHGETAATHEGITADLEAFRWAGVGGVVYYDQVHGNGEGAFAVFSPEWWDELIFSSQEARRLGPDDSLMPSGVETYDYLKIFFTR